MAEHGTDFLASHYLSDAEREELYREADRRWEEIITTILQAFEKYDDGEDREMAEAWDLLGRYFGGIWL